jgi:hypothetical protein
MKMLPFLLLLCCFKASAQQYTRAEIKHASDSIMKIYLRSDMYARCESDFDKDAVIVYTYTNDKGKLKYAEVPRQPKALTKGRFKSVEVGYIMKYPYGKCRIPDEVNGRLYVKLDRWLDMSHAPDIGFIPDYVWEKDSCRLPSYGGR